MKKLNNLSFMLVGVLIGLLSSATAIAVADSPIKLIINGKQVQCDVQPQVINGRVLVPARFVAEELGATVSWDSANNAVVVNGTGYAPANNIYSDKEEAKAYLQRINTVSKSSLDIITNTSATKEQINTSIKEVSSIINDLPTWAELEDFTPLKKAYNDYAQLLLSALIVKQDIANGEVTLAQGTSQINNILTYGTGAANSIKYEVERLKKKGLL